MRIALFTSEKPNNKQNKLSLLLQEIRKVTAEIAMLVCRRSHFDRAITVYILNVSGVLWLSKHEARTGFRDDIIVYPGNSLPYYLS